MGSARGALQDVAVYLHHAQMVPGHSNSGESCALRQQAVLLSLLAV